MLIHKKVIETLRRLKLYQAFFWSQWYETRINYMKRNRAFPGGAGKCEWVRIWLPSQGTQVQSTVWEDPTCRGATKRMCQNN